MDGFIQNILPPLLSELDETDSSEGALDPLGLYAIADSLGVLIARGVRERQHHPRYLTAIAVGAEVCSQFPEDAVAADGVSEPWQVFEWYAVEGLVRRMDAEGDISGLPGKDKVRRCIQEKVGVSARSYLKTPSVFGFHGVYRLLARTLGVIDDNGRLSVMGDRLLSTWVREQGLEGFRISDSRAEGSGAVLRRKLVQAVEEGMAKGATDRPERWEGWDFFIRHLHPFRFGKAEGAVILDALLDKEPLRSELIRFLISDTGQAVMRGSEDGKEKAVHRKLHEHGSAQIKQLLNAVMAYERFARLLQDVFDDCLHYLTQSARKTSPSELARLESVAAACERVPALFPEVTESLVLCNEQIRFTRQFSLFMDRLKPTDWVSRLIEHHCSIQAAKPPDGKAPWIYRFDDGSVTVRTAYQRKEGGNFDESYVHAYRTHALWSFLKDLGMVAA